MLINFIGIVLILYATILTATGPELKEKGVVNRIKETLDIYRYVIALIFVGAYLSGV
jgi:hypothetical protein